MCSISTTFTARPNRSCPSKPPGKHAAIVMAIADHDPQQASARMIDHIDRTYEALLMGP